MRWIIAGLVTLASIAFLAVTSPPTIAFMACGGLAGLSIAWAMDRPRGKRP